MAIILLFALSLIFLFTTRKPVFFQWLLIVLLFDPTGHITRYFSKTYSWGIEQTDVILLLLIISFFLVGSRRLSDFFSNKDASVVFRILSVFFIYRIVVYGYIVPPVDSLEEYFRYFLVRERTAMISFIFMVPAYLLARRDLKTFFRLYVVLGTFAVVFFLVSVLTGIQIIPFSTMQRYLTGGVLRQFMYSYSAPLMLVILSIVIFISKIELRFKKLLYIGSIFSILSVIISLTKGLYLILIAVIIISAFFTARTLRISISRGVQQAVLLGLVAIVALILVLPSYLGFSKRLFGELYSLGKTGTYGEGKTEGRLDYVLPAQLFMIKQRPLFGTGMHGYNENNLSKKFDKTAYDSTDVSITGTIMQYGILGMIIYYFFYFKYFKAIRNFYLAVKGTPRSALTEKFKYEFIISIALISLFLGSLVQVNTITGELTSGVPFYMNVGILLACIERFRNGVLTDTNSKRLPAGENGEIVN